MKLALALVTLTGVAVAWAPPATMQGPANAVRPVVVAELFTSEGCSSCPPADAFLQQVVSEQPIAGVEIVGLEEHVDYFDNLGWRDPFASPQFTKRQSEYEERVFRTGDIFTPQLVIDGAVECTGNDRAAARRALTAAARGPKATLILEPGVVTANRWPVTIGVEMPLAAPRHGAADVIVAVVERGLASDVKRGENHGRTLTHGAVVRAMVSAGTLARDDREFHATTAVAIGAGWNRPNLRIVALVQEQASRRILGAAITAP